MKGYHYMSDTNKFIVLLNKLIIKNHGSLAAANRGVAEYELSE